MGVDPVSRRELWKIVYDLVETERIGVLVSTAYLDEAQRCDQVNVLHKGRLLAQGRPDEFTSEMQGRVFLAAPDEQMRGRQIYTRLAGQEGIADATIRSGRVRVVVDSGNLQDSGKQKIATLLNRPDDTITPAAPTFEDAFMALVPKGDAQLHASSQRSKTPWVTESLSEDQAAVTTNSLCKKFGDFTAVSNLTLEVRQGEIFGLLGPNGAGKSTTFRMLCGLLPATSGKSGIGRAAICADPGPKPGRAWDIWPSSFRFTASSV